MLDDFVSRLLPLRDRLRRYASSIVGSAEGEDVAQQVLVRLWERREDLDEVQSLPALSLAMARNACIDRLRRTRTAKRALVGDDLREEPRVDPEEAFERSDAYRRVLALLGRLPAGQRQALVMRDLAECSYAEIAGALGSTPMNARMRVCRARQALRKLYEETHHAR
jgi:RNA polymerase sigma-70 factor (ECF subfamily)